jgi:hypothetical protein
VFVGHSRKRTGHACRIVDINPCAAGLRGGLHCRLVEGYRGEALWCSLMIRGNEEWNATRKTRTEGGREG